MTTFILTILAAVAISLQPVQPPARFTRAILDHCRPVATATFVGCEARPGWTEETLFAGFRQGRPVTGP